MIQPIKIDISKSIKPVDVSKLKISGKIEPLVKKRDIPKKEQDIIDMLKDTCDFAGSFSRLNTDCPMEYKLNYVDRVEKDRDGVYGIMGGICHDINEAIYLGEHDNKWGLEEFDNKFRRLRDFDVEFPSDKIKNSYYNNINSYYKNMQMLDELPILNESGIVKTELETEIFMWAKFEFKSSGLTVGMYGYCDLLHKVEYIERSDENGVLIENNEVKYIIGDFKTSSIGSYLPSSKKRIGYGRQLIIYSMMWNMMNGFDKPNQLYWNMLKYCKLTFKTPFDFSKLKATELKELCEKVLPDFDRKGKQKKHCVDIINQNYDLFLPYAEITEKVYNNVERQDMANKIVKHLKTYIEINNIDCEEFLQENDIKYLPEKLKQFVKLEDCILEYEHTAESQLECLTWIRDRVKLIFEMIQHNQFIADMSKDNRFFCDHLCSFYKKCPDNANRIKAEQDKLRNNVKLH